MGGADGLDAIEHDFKVWEGSVLGNFDADDPEAPSSRGEHPQVVKAGVEETVKVSGGRVRFYRGSGFGGVQADDLYPDDIRTGGDDDFVAAAEPKPRRPRRWLRLS